MNRNMEDLNSRFLTILNRVLRACEKRGYHLKPYCTKRDVWEQAKLYRQSRTWLEIKKDISNLKNDGADFLAKVLLEVGPQYGRWATNALPGFSWHQYGEACDCFVLENYKAIWNPNHEGYLVFHEEAIKRGIVTLRTIHDANHIQLKLHSPTFYYRIDTIDGIMKKSYKKVSK